MPTRDLVEESGDGKSTLGGSGRFEILERIGAGGMGTVYIAFDRERQEEVALKLLHTRDAEALYRFKKEFRALADVAHRNLVSLYELVVEDDQWFFTMEIVRGEGLFETVRPGCFPERPPGESLGGELDLGLLRQTLGQLTLGVKALHDAGKLHCDLKPSNVMVNSTGRLVVLDFGLATELAIELQTRQSGVVGTIAYMAPEQARSEGIGPASDWYAVGVILFEALTGYLPFSGSLFEVLMGKQQQEAPSPRKFASDLPRDLVELCEDLLALDPEQRPRAQEILERLGVQEEVTTDSVFLPTELVGRHRQLEQLEEAFALSRSGEEVVVYVHGSSGMGKTALIHRFLEGCAAEALILRGRCYEREMVPYKALDGVVDSLSRHLSTLDDRRLRSLLPEDFDHSGQALLRIFPVLQQVDLFYRFRRKKSGDEADLLTQRRQAFEGLRQLLARLADRQPLVLYIDDLHWADADSAALLNELLRSPDPPRLMLVASFRSEEIERKTFLSELLAETGTPNRRQVILGALGPAEARELAAGLLEGDAAASEAVLRVVVKEGQGSPFLLEQLARFVQVKKDIESTGLRLVEMLEERLRQLPRGARQLLHTLVVANRPLRASVAFKAAGLEGDERPLVAGLRTACFVRSSGSAQRIEMYHDRIAETLAQALEREDERRIHRQLAETLEAEGLDDPEALFGHWLGAGDRRAAAKWAGRSAEKAFDALAFDPAARFYQQALDLAPVHLEREDLLRGLALSLANAGRSAEAAQAYLDLAGTGEAMEALEAQGRAAEQYLLGGYVEEGLALARVVLQAVNLNMASGPRRALVSLLYNRLRLRLRGLGFEERTEADLSKEDLLRIDTCWAVGTGLSMVDNIQGADFQTRSLLLALAAGEPYRIARAMALESGIHASTGQFDRAETLLDRARELANQVEHPHALGLVTFHQGLVDYFSGRNWHRAIVAFDEAERTFTEKCRGVVWEITACRRFGLASLLYEGEIAELVRRVPMVLAEARERGNTHLIDHVRSRVNLVWLAADHPDDARRRLEESIRHTREDEKFSVHRYNVFMAQLQTDLYCNEPRTAWNRMSRQWHLLDRSMLTRVQLVRLESWHVRARVALALAASGEKEPLPLVEQMAGRIDAKKRPWTKPWSALLRAGAAHLEGDADKARNQLRWAVEGFDEAGMGLYAAAARFRLGEVLAGDEGAEYLRASTEWMAEQRIRNPTRMVALLAPGFDDAEPS